MCGIFGFLSTGGRGPELDRLRKIATQTQRRGEHAFGLAWLDQTGRTSMFKRPGPATQRLADIDRCRGAQIVVGHCRWATHGSPDENHNNHPHRAGRGWIVHNGVVRNYRQLLRRYAFEPQTECDSEILGLLLRRFGGSLTSRAMQTAAVAEGPLAMLGIWSSPARLMIVRRGNPLWYGANARGLYFASLPEALPGFPREITDGFTTVVTPE